MIQQMNINTERYYKENIQTPVYDGVSDIMYLFSRFVPHLFLWTQCTSPLGNT